MEELYNDLFGKGLYTKSLTDFEKQFTGREDVLFDALGTDYASDLDEFKQKYFSPGKKQGPAKDAAVVGPMKAVDSDLTFSDGSLDFLELDKTFKGTLEEPANPMYQLVDTLGKQKEAEIENEWLEESLLPKKTGYIREDGVTKRIEVPVYPKGYKEYMEKSEGNLDLAKKMYLKDKKSEIVGEELSKYISDKNSDELEEYFDEYKDLKIDQTEKLSDVVDINSTSLKYLKDETINAVDAIQKIDKAFERAELLSPERIKELIDYREGYIAVAKQAIKKSQDLVNTNTKLAYLLEDEEKFIDAAKRSYDLGDILGYSALASTGEMIAGVIDLPKMFIASTLSGILDQDLDDVDRAVVAAFAPFQFADNLRKGSAELREGIAKPISISDVENMSDFGEWAGSLIGNMAPQIALGVATGGGGWAASTAMGVSSAAGKYSDLLKEMEEGAEYTTAQVLSSALISGAAETLSEKITFNQFKGIKEILKRNPKSLKAAQEYIQNNIAKGAYFKTTGQEALSEVAAQLANNMVDINILEKKDVKITDGLLDSLAGGAFMSGVMFKSPAVLANVYHKIRGTEAAEKLLKNAIQISKLDEALADLEKKESTPENEAVKKGLIESIDKIAKNSLNAMTGDVQLVNFMTKSEKAEIESLNEKKADIEANAKTIFNNKDLDPDIRKQQLDELNTQYKEVTKRRSFLSKVAAIRVNQGKDAKSLQEAWDRSQDVMKRFANQADLNIDYIEFNSTNFESKIKDLNLTEAEKQNLLENNGTFLEAGKKPGIDKDIIFINKDLDAAYGVTTTVQHELLHVVLNKVVKDQLSKAGKGAADAQAIIDGMGLKLYDELSKVKGFNDTSLAKRFDSYLRNGSFALEELITVLSEHISETKAKKGTFDAIVEFFKDLYAKFTGQQLQLETADDLLGFVNSYTKMFDAGKIDTDISGAVKEARVKIDLNVNRAQVQERLNQIKKERGIESVPTVKNIDSKASKYFDDELTQLAKDFEDGVIPEDEYLQRIDALMDEIEKAEAANEEAEDFTPVKKQPKKAKKQKSELEIELAGKAKKHKALLDSIGNDPNGYNPNDSRIWETLGNMIESKARNYTTAKGDYAPLTNLPGFDMESLVAETQASLVNYIKKFDPSLNDSLYGYINAQLQNRMRAALKTGKVAGTEFMTDVTEAKGIAYTEEGYVEVKGKEYTRISDSKAFSDELIEKAKADLLRVVRVLKSKIDAPMTNNQSISPLMREIIQGTKNMMDAAIKVEMGGKKDGKLRKWLQANKKMVIENSTTTFLMGKDAKTVVKGGIPQAIQKQINGRFVSYPEWVGKTPDRETTFSRGNTAGNYIVRRVPASQVSESDFLSQVLNVNGNPIPGRKEAIAMHLSSELSVELFIQELMNEDSDISKAFETNRELRDEILADNALAELSKQAERGLIKNSLRDYSIMEMVSKRVKNDKLKNAIKVYIDSKDPDKLTMTGLLGYIKEEGLLDNISAFDKVKVYTGAILAFNSEDVAGKTVEFFTNLDGFFTEAIYKRSFVTALKLIDNIVATKDKEGITEGLLDFINKYSKGFRNLGLGLTRNQQLYDYINFRLNQAGSEFTLEDLEFTLTDISTGKTIIATDVVKSTTTLTTSNKIVKSGSNIESIKNSVDNYNSFTGQYRRIVIDEMWNKPELLNEVTYLLSRTMDSALRRSVKITSYIKDFWKSKTAYIEHKKSIYTVSRELIEARRNSKTKEEFELAAKKIFDSSEAVVMSKKTGKEIEVVRNKEGKRIFDADRYAELELDKQLVPFKFSARSEADINKEFNKMLERKSGIKAGKKISEAAAYQLGKYKGKLKLFIPPNAEDFVGLLYSFLGKGKQGDMDFKFFKELLIDPFNKAEQRMSEFRQDLSKDLKSIKKEIGNLATTISPETKEKLKKLGFTPDRAVRIHIWASRGEDIPDLTKGETRLVRAAVLRDLKLLKYTKEITNITNKYGGYPPPSESWFAGNITTDFYEYANNNVRQGLLEEWQGNIDIIFNPANKSKLKAIYGKDFVKNLELSIQRMKSGVNKFHSQDKFGQTAIDLINGSVGVIMFLNMRSAVLQTISAVNFINWTDNNPIAMAKTLANPNEFASMFKKLLNSDFLKQRREGLELNVSEAEIADAATNAKNMANKLYHKAIKLGYKPTQFADSFAIALGGTSFVMNRIKTYEKEGFSKTEAYEKAYNDFREIAEENQQSSRTDKISNIQSSSLVGRLIFAFNNTPFQYTRIIKKAALDLANGRGDWKTNLSKILYYGAVQNAIFYTLQQALFRTMFDDDEEEVTKTELKLLNNMADSLLRGSGLPGAIVSMIKNVIIKAKEEEQKGWKMSPEKIALELTSVSPPISYKLKKFASSVRSYKYAETDYDKIRAAARMGSVVNLPVDRLLTKYENINTAATENVDNWVRFALLAGWGKYELGLYDKDKKKAKKTNNAIKTLKIKPIKIKPIKIK